MSLLLKTILIAVGFLVILFFVVMTFSLCKIASRCDEMERRYYGDTEYEDLRAQMDKSKHHNV